MSGNEKDTTSPKSTAPKTVASKKENDQRLLKVENNLKLELYAILLLTILVLLIISIYAYTNLKISINHFNFDVPYPNITWKEIVDSEIPKLIPKKWI